jgi:2-hydroxycyclohexanecarboxyl-CoA dehydrogenase
VTGAASGIGAATVTRLVAAGHHVFAADIAPSLDDRWGDVAAVTAAYLDVSDREQIEAVREAVAADGRPLAGLVNAAGRSGRAFLLDFDDDEFDALVAVNLYGVAACVRAFAPLMRAAGRGSIVNVASMAARKPDKTLAVYAAAKAGVVQLSRIAALELARYSIRVNAVLPGPVDTPMLRTSAERVARLRSVGVEDVLDSYRATVPLGRLGEADELAALIAFLVSDEASFVTGEVIGAGGGNDLG